MNKWMKWLNKQLKGQSHELGETGAGRTRSNQMGNGASQSVPIREIQATHTLKIQKHLKALGGDDRYLRFGYAATDEQIEAYVASLDFVGDSLFGIYNRRLDLIGMAHLSYYSINPEYASCAEFGVSVTKTARGRGYGTRLFERAITHSRNEGVRMLFVHALSENTAMIKIAKRAGAKVERDGSNSQAHLLLPPADFDSRVEEMLDQQVAWTDYQLKTQAKLFWAWLGLKRTNTTGSS